MTQGRLLSSAGVGVLAFLSSLLLWQNVLFATAVVLGAALFGMHATGLFGDHDGHALDDGHGHDHHHDHGHSSSLIQKTLGLGRLPLALSLPVALGSFGFGGLFASVAFGTFAALSGVSVLTFGGTVGVGLVAAFISVQLAGRIFRSIVPDNPKTASDRHDLLGLLGKVMSGKVDREYGQVQVIDNFGRTLEVACTTDQAEPIAYGVEVVLVEWEPASNRFRVAPLGLNEANRGERQ